MDETLERALLTHIEVSDGCWRWLGGHNDRGYPRLVLGRQGRFGRDYAHRLAYIWAHGPIPHGHHVHHTCHNKRCVNPAHLEALAPREHALADGNPITSRCLLTHCQRGHAFDSANTRRRPNGTRCCRACHRENQRTRPVDRAKARIYEQRYRDRKRGLP